MDFCAFCTMSSPAIVKEDLPGMICTFPAHESWMLPPIMTISEPQASLMMTLPSSPCQMPDLRLSYFDRLTVLEFEKPGSYVSRTFPSKSSSSGVTNSDSSLAYEFFMSYATLSASSSCL